MELKTDTFPSLVIRNLDPDIEKWETLIEQIIAGNVIPVIGPDILVDDYDIHQAVINALAAQCNVTSGPTTFSQLIYDKNFPVENRENIYSWLNQLCKDNRFRPSKLLKRLLAIRQFPFVMTTSFFPVVEQAMQEEWGERKVKTMVFSNNPSTTKKAGTGDLAAEEDINNPTVYYMFGKHCNSAHRFVVTDTDMLCFCKSWLSNGDRPTVLSSVLKKKYLLVLGSNYSDWLFRFIWYSMNQNDDPKYPFANTLGMMVDKNADDSLVAFLNRLQTFTQKDPLTVIETIERKLEEKKEEIESHKFDHPACGADVFLSYSRKDKHIADKMYELLTRRGLKVWYDKKKLKTGTEWMLEIEKSIETAKFFVPVLTSNVMEEGNEYHVYRKEWKIAVGRADGYERKFVLPVASRDFDFYRSEVTKSMDNRNAFTFESENDFEAFADIMLEYVNQL